MINSIKFALKDSITIPETPQLSFPLNKAQGISDSVILSWSQVEFADLYSMQLSRDSSFANILLDSTIANATSVLIRDLSASQKYFWHVRAINNSGKSNFTSTRMFTTAEALLNYPALVTPKNNSIKIPIDVTFEWSNIANAGSYNLQVASSPSICSIILDTVIVNDTSFVKRGLEYGKVYYWHVRSLPKEKSTFAAGTFSEWYSFTTTGSPPSVPILLFPADDEKIISVSTALRWKASEHAESYSVRISTDNSFTKKIIDTTDITNTNLKIKDMLPATTFYWSVNAFNEFGNSGWSETRKFTTAGKNDRLTQIDGEANRFELFQNYPNLFNTKTIIRFALSTGCDVQIMISDILGEYRNIVQNLKLDAGIYEIQFNGFDLASGVYFYTIIANAIDNTVKQKTFVQTKKMVKIK